MSDTFSPSVIQSLVNKAKLGAFSLQGAGAAAPTFVSSNGLKSVTRNSAGNYTVALQNQYRALVDAQMSLQFALAPAGTLASVTSGTGTAAIKITAGADVPNQLGNNMTLTISQSVQASLKIGTTNSITVTAGSDYPGAAGNAINVVVTQGTTLVVSLGVDGSSNTEITIALATGGSIPSAIQTAFNAAIPTNIATISAITGTATIVVAAEAPLANGAGFNATTTVVTSGVAITIWLPVAGATASAVKTAFNAAVPTAFAVASLPGSGAGTLLVATVASFTGGLSGLLVGNLQGINVTQAGTGAQSFTINLFDPATGVATDMPSGAGNLINVELTLKDAR